MWPALMSACYMYIIIIIRIKCFVTGRAINFITIL